MILSSKVFDDLSNLGTNLICKYIIEGQIPIKADAYSCEIILMEIFIKKKPTDEMFAEEMSLKRWITDLLPVSMMEVLDTNLPSREDKFFAAKELCVIYVRFAYGVYNT